MNVYLYADRGNSMKSKVVANLSETPEQVPEGAGHDGPISVRHGQR